MLGNLHFHHHSPTHPLHFLPPALISTLSTPPASPLWLDVLGSPRSSGSMNVNVGMWMTEERVGVEGAAGKSLTWFVMHSRGEHLVVFTRSPSGSTDISESTAGCNVYSRRWHVQYFISFAIFICNNKFRSWRQVGKHVCALALSSDIPPFSAHPIFKGSGRLIMCP